MKKLLCALLAITTAATVLGCKKNDTAGTPSEKDTVTVYLPSEKVSYTEDGQVLSKTTYEYDAKGRLLREAYDAPEAEEVWSEEHQAYLYTNHSCDGTPNRIEEYTYDDRGNVTAYTDQVLENDQWKTDISYAYSYTYGENGEITAFRQHHIWGDTVTDREFTLEYTDSTPTKLWCKAAGSDEDPQLIGDYTYNESNQLTQCKLTNIGSSGPFHYSFTYNQKNQLTAFIGRSPNQEPSFDLRFTYDNQGHLLTKQCAAPQHQRFTLSYSYTGDILTGVNRNGNEVFQLDGNGCAIRPVGETYEYHYTTLELSHEDAQNLRYQWQKSHSDNTSSLMFVSTYSDLWSPYFMAVKHPLHEIGPMLPSFL